MSEASTPQEAIPEAPVPTVLVKVRVVHPLHEDGKNYRVGDALKTTEVRGRFLVALGLAAWPPPPPLPRRPWWQFWRTSTRTTGGR